MKNQGGTSLFKPQESWQNVESTSGNQFKSTLYNSCPLKVQNSFPNFCARLECTSTGLIVQENVHTATSTNM